MNQHQTLIACGFALMCALLGSVSHYNAKKAMHELPPMLFLFYRTVAGSACLLLMALIFEREALSALPQTLTGRNVLLLLGAFTCLIGIGTQLFFVGLKTCDLGTMATAINTSPLVVLVLTVLLFKQMPTWPQLGGELVAMAGILLLGWIIVRDRGTGDAKTKMRGLMIGLVAAASMGVGMMLVKQVTEGSHLPTKGNDLPPITLTLVMLVPGLVVFGIGALVGGRATASRRALLHTASSGVLSWGLGLYCMTEAFNRTPLNLTSLISVCLAMNMVFGVIIGWLYLGETLTRPKVAAFGVILAGICLVFLPVG